MTVKVTIGVDVGTQGSKAGVYTTEGVLVGNAYAPHRINYDGPGIAEMEPAQLVDAAFIAMRGAVDEAVSAGIDRGDIAGVALSGILVGQVLLDDSGNVLRPIITSLDTRCAELAATAARELEPLWLSESGTSTLDAYSAPFHLQWVQSHQPEIWAKVARTVSVAPYVSAVLAGLPQEMMYTEPTHLSGWMVGWDQRSRNFSPRQLADLGIPSEILPRVVESTDVIGEVTGEAAALTGVPAGTPIIAGAGDVMQSNLASGLVEPGQAADVAGTTSILTVGVEDIIPEVTNIPGMLYSLGTVPGQSFYWGYIRAGGMSLRWFRDSVGGDEHRSYADYDRLAQSVAPGSDGVLFLPYLAGGNPDSPHASGTWLGLESGTGTGQLWRSVLESIAFEYHDTLSVFRDNGMDLSEVLVTGGGAASATWNQIKADLTGIPWRVPGRLDGPALANAALANQSLGLAGDMTEQLREWTAGGDRQEPVSAHHQAYSRAAGLRSELLAGPMQEVFSAVHQLRYRG